MHMEQLFFDDILKKVKDVKREKNGNFSLEHEISNIFRFHNFSYQFSLTRRQLYTLRWIMMKTQMNSSSVDVKY
jgi:hypothetical protein